MFPREDIAFVRAIDRALPKLLMKIGRSRFKAIAASVTGFPPPPCLKSSKYLTKMLRIAYSLNQGGATHELPAARPEGPDPR